MGDRVIQGVGPFSIDGGDELEVSHGLAGTWKLIGATVTPHTTLAAHASNVQTITLKKEDGGTALGYLTSDSDDADYGAAFTKGTPRHFTFTATGKDLEFTKNNCLEVVVAEGGTCAALDASLTLVWEEIRVPA
jgi:hypothetical protein